MNRFKTPKIFFIHAAAAALLAALFVLPAHAAGENAGSEVKEGPSAVVAEPNYIFPAALDGTNITHTYTIENRGNAPLMIEKLKSSCGCTTGDYTEVIPPGKSGSVTVVGDTTGYGNRKFNSTIVAFTNDPANPEIKLTLSGPVEIFATLSRENVRLSGDADETVTAEIMITTAGDREFSFIDATYLSGKFLRHTLEKTPDGFRLILENTLKKKGRYYDVITLTADLPGNPTLAVRILGDIRE